MSLTGALDVFFKKLFSKMFELLSVPHKFSDQYLDCVTSQMQNLKPFGDTPGKLSTQVKRSFVAARTFVQGLAIGRDVILEVLKVCIRNFVLASSNSFSFYKKVHCM